MQLARLASRKSPKPKPCESRNSGNRRPQHDHWKCASLQRKKVAKQAREQEEKANAALASAREKATEAQAHRLEAEKALKELG